MDRTEFYLFKTSVNTHIEINELTPYLKETIISGEWHFDLDDVDNVFCLYCESQIKECVEQLFREKGFSIKELNYLDNEMQIMKTLR